MPEDITPYKLYVNRNPNGWNIQVFRGDNANSIFHYHLANDLNDALNVCADVIVADERAHAANV